MSDQPISVQLYSVRDALAGDLPGTLQRLADLGFRDVELYGFVERPQMFASALAAAGLTASSGHASLLGLGDARPAFEAARTAGVRTVIEPHHDPDRWSQRAEVERIAQQLNGLAETAAEFELAVGYHNHWFEIENRIDGRPALQVLAEHLDPAVALEVDTFWVEVGGVSAPDLLQLLGDRVRFIHVKDGAISRDTSTQQPAGQGALDVPAVLAAAPQARRVIEFDDYGGDVFDGLAQSLSFVQAHD